MKVRIVSSNASHPAPIFMRRFAGLLLCALLLFGGHLSTAYAQDSRIAIGAGGGVSVPFGPASRYAPRWEEPDHTGNSGSTILTGLRPKTGMTLHVEALIGKLSIRYHFERYLWRPDRVACTPMDERTPAAIRLPNGEFDDRNVRYDCAPPRTYVAPERGRRALMFHELTLSYEIKALRPRHVIPYASLGGGFLLTTFHQSEQNAKIRLGLSILVGGGLLIPFDRNISMIIEAHYALYLMARGGDYSLRAGRAVAADKSILSAVIDPMHSFQAIVGFRVRIR